MDGRQRLESRNIQLKVGTVPSCYGSASVHCGGTKAIASVQAELSDTGAEGSGASVEVSVTCSNMPSSAGRQAEDMSAALTADANRIFARPIPTLIKSLMVSDRHAWKLFVDVMLVEYDGCLLDVVSIAVWAALSDTKLPTLSTFTNADGSVGVELSLEMEEKNKKPLDLSSVPTYVSITQVGKHFIADATAIEEACAGCRISYAINARNEVCCIHKSEGRGLKPTQIVSTMGAATQFGSNRMKFLDKKLQDLIDKDSGDDLLDRDVL
ncbi:hypothetical protein GUITHDRAFT_155941 [Guillardia theta CCMP2712]|uniref:Ribosomal RNA-processing protein 42 n=2 Tax=Guillardia theta TaxID=55529 RepID=L1IC35_GUITC|nr:hypothetical protein GUITHDRAFT_155941 [Guillardia theta CCMP2712]EKX33768.1 hypothetical protein GUITHDRAFT_155941 [Guillardia theta CCMP2712]|eukprot:XP_005820748.1 hypothetical protein GUITHDRAFT_155941 [Guillardia theta CCMP2712]